MITKLSYIPDSLGYLPFTEMLDTVKALGVNKLEIPTGGWSSAPHINIDSFVSDKTYRDNFMGELKSREIEISAFNCSGNPLAYDNDLETAKKTFIAAELVGVDKIVMMSGLPAGAPGDKMPTWIITSWPPETQTILKYQWEEVAFPVRTKLAAEAKSRGIKKIALENHGFQLVYNPKTLFKLREEIGNIIGMNLDPSHMFWMNIDPIVAARKLGSALYHIHGKDARLEKVPCAVNGPFDTSTIDCFKDRTWNYVAVGHGHDMAWWKEFFSVVAMQGYDDVVSLEMEDLTLSPMQGIVSSLNALKEAMTIL